MMETTASQGISEDSSLSSSGRNSAATHRNKMQGATHALGYPHALSSSQASAASTHAEAASAEAAAAAAAITITPAERDRLDESATLAQDQLSCTRSGPILVQGGLSPFGTLLALWHEPAVGASVRLNRRVSLLLSPASERGVDVLVGISSRGYILVWSMGAAMEEGTATHSTRSKLSDAKLEDFERIFIGDTDQQLTAAVFTLPPLQPAAPPASHPSLLQQVESKQRDRGALSLFVVTEEGHGLTYAIELGLVEEDEGDTQSTVHSGLQDESKATEGSPTMHVTAPPKSTRDVTRRIGILSHKRVLLRKALYPREHASQSHAGHPTNLLYDAPNRVILLSVGTELYSFNELTLQTMWTASVGAAILGNHAVPLAAAEAAAQVAIEQKTGAPTLASGRMDAKQKRAHAITCVACPSVSSLASAHARALTDSAHALSNRGSLSTAAAAAAFALAPPPFVLLGTLSGFLLRVELRKREVLPGGAVVKFVPEVRVIARMQEHQLVLSQSFYTDSEESAGSSAPPAVTLAAQQREGVTAAQREELARKKESERRRKYGALGEPATPTTPAPHTTETPGASPASSVAPCDLPSAPLLVCSPWYDPNLPDSARSSRIAATAFGTGIASVAVCWRKGEWLVMVGCLDGMVHVMNTSNKGMAKVAGGDARVKYTLSAANNPTYPIFFDSSLPASLLYTFVDPPIHSTSTRLPSVVRLTTSHDGSVLIAIDAAGVMRRWDVDACRLVGRTYTEGIIPAPPVQAWESAEPLLQSAVLTSAVLQMEFLYPLESEVISPPTITRTVSVASESTIQTEPSVATAVSPSHLLILSDATFTLWRLMRSQTIVVNVRAFFVGAATAIIPSSDLKPVGPNRDLLSELDAFIAGYKLEAKHESNGVSGSREDEKIKRVAAAHEVHEKAIQRRNSLPSSSSSHAQLSAASDSLPASHVSLSATPSYPALTDESPSDLSARFDSSSQGVLMSSHTYSEGDVGSVGALPAPIMQNTHALYGVTLTSASSNNSDVHSVVTMRKGSGGAAAAHALREAAASNLAAAHSPASITRTPSISPGSGNNSSLPPPPSHLIIPSPDAPHFSADVLFSSASSAPTRALTARNSGPHCASATHAKDYGPAQMLDIDTPERARESSAQVLPAVSITVTESDDEKEEQSPAEQAPEQQGS